MSPQHLFFRLFVFLSVMLTTHWTAPAAHAESTQTLTIAAANSLRDAFRTILPLFEAEYPDTTIRVVYAPSQTLRDQIAQGAPVDVFLPSLVEEIDDLGKKSLLVEGGKRIYAGTSLVLITNSALPAPVGSIQDLETIPVRRLALGDPKTASVGKVAAEFVTYAKLDKRLRPQYLYGEHSRAVLDLVSTGEAELGLVYRTDAVSNAKVRIVDTVPPVSHTKIQYGAAITWSSQNISGARNFIDFLLTSKVQDRLQENGFDRVDSGVGVASREEGK